MDQQHLVDAIKCGDLAAVEEALSRGADPDALLDDGSGWRLLNLAIEFDQPRIVQLLIEAGADVNRGMSDGWTPLHHAVDVEGDAFHQTDAPRDLRLIQLLLDAGADPRSTATVGVQHESPLEMARDAYRYDQAVDAMQARIRGTD